MRDNPQLTIEQQVWLAAWTAAVASPAMYNPAKEAESCLAAFRQKFTPTVGGRKLRLLEAKHDIDEADDTEDSLHDK